MYSKPEVKCTVDLKSCKFFTASLLYQGKKWSIFTSSTCFSQAIQVHFHLNLLEQKLNFTSIDLDYTHVIIYLLTSSRVGEIIRAPKPSTEVHLCLHSTSITCQHILQINYFLFCSLKVLDGLNSLLSQCIPLCFSKNSSVTFEPHCLNKRQNLITYRNKKCQSFS